MVPTLGYPSRTAAALALRDQGLTSAEIAARIGVDSSRVAALIYHGRKARGPRRLESMDITWRTVRMPGEVLDRLRPHAAARRITVNELARRIVEAVADDNLVDGVLDDAEED